MSPTHKKQDPTYKAVNKDKKGPKGQRGRSAKKGDDKNEGSGNSKRNNDTTPKRIVVIKTERNQDMNSTTTSPTLAITQQRARLGKKGNDDTASTHEIDSEEGEIEDDTFLEELFNTSMESLNSSEDSSDESTLIVTVYHNYHCSVLIIY